MKVQDNLEGSGTVSLAYMIALPILMELDPR
jgi:hypothetical protein